jgi:hypothetical protein
VLTALDTGLELANAFGVSWWTLPVFTALDTGLELANAFGVSCGGHYLCSPLWTLGWN